MDIATLKKVLDQQKVRHLNAGDYQEYLGGRGYDEPQAFKDGWDSAIETLWPLILAYELNLGEDSKKTIYELLRV
jgi:hypothetical protein